ncbi:MAG: virulence RhuM family protein [Kiritimatiellae bacterium]|nr:virulence RhuM family protein [Kiritimatiellia bacterium]
MLKNEIVVYQPNETVRLEVRLENETVWLNQARLGELFGVDRTVINRHVHNIYRTHELEEAATCAKIAQVQKEGGRTITRQMPFYNLDMIIAVGYRVNSFAATQFRKWATGVLREYLLRGYAFSQRFNQLEDKMDRRLAKTEADIAELKDKVDFFVQTKEPPLQKIFYQGKFWDAKKEIFWTSGRARRSRMLAASPLPPRRWARKSCPGFSNQSARLLRNGGNTARVRRRRGNLAERRGCDILCAW